MTRKSDTVRFSRAGDQFHYRWAARRCLALLDPASGLVCITIEGISSDESEVEKTESGEEVVDVAEYYGGNSIKRAKNISYHQLKHSYKTDEPWTLSGLSKTLEGFFKRYEVFKKEAEDIGQQGVEFTFTTNRPVAIDVHELVGRIKKRSLNAEDAKRWDQLKGYLNTDDDDLAYEFFVNFRIDDGHDIHWRQRNILIEELSGYIAGPDKEAADQLWRLVIDKAMPEDANKPEITREEVLRYLNTDIDELFPAPCLIERGSEHFSREQEDDFLRNILTDDGRPIIIHAEGGIGKTALANRLRGQVPSHSVAVLYDCFGNGEYRNILHLRHPHKIGLVQIANELASLKLCHPLIPSAHAQPSHYLKAFNYRLEQAVQLLRGQNSDAKLVIFIDAADNAEMAAEEYNERASFAKDLIRQKLPEGVVLVFLCRSHRVAKLDPPVEYVDLPLQAFSEAETEKLIRQKFPDATRHDIQEFHRLSSQNPRVQATALERGFSLHQTLAMLGPNPTTAEDAIKRIFEQSIKKLLDAVPKEEAQQINALCESLAALRPFIPIEVLALVSGMDESAIKSFLVDLGRPLSFIGDAVQFFDEPSETWFRETYKPTTAKLTAFINALRPLAKGNSYVASALPQLMLEAGQYEELVELVLDDAELPTENPVDRRNTALQRLQFALKAALRMKRYDDAAKLALKAGGETAGNDRQQALLQGNTDLVSQLLPEHRLREIVAQKPFSTGWHGGHHAYEASLLSGCRETLPESRSYLRLAHKWVHNWSKLSKNDRKEEKMGDHDIAEMALCQLYLNGAEAFVGELVSWNPRSVAYRVGLIVFRKLVDLGRVELLDEIASHSSGNLCIFLALIDAQNPILRYPIAEVARGALDGLRNYSRQLKKFQDGPSYEEPLLSVVNSVVQAAISRNIFPHSEIADILDIYIPAPERYYFNRHSDEPRFTLLRANCMRAALRRETVELPDLAKPEVKEQLEKQSHYHKSDTREFREVVGAALPWHKLWTRVLLRQVEAKELDTEIEQCLSASKSAYTYHEENRFTSKEISRLWVEILILSDPTPQRMEKFLAWKDSLKQKLFTPALTRLTKLCTYSDAYKDYSFAFAQEAFEIIDQDRMDAEQKVESYIEISRAVYALEKKEALYYFDKAVEVAGRIGEENLDRWSSLLELSFAASEPGIPKPELSYRLSRAAEVVYDFVARDKYFDWKGTIYGITKLCPASSLAILSRWRDRRFCRENREFPRAIKQLVELKKLSPDSALALIGYQYRWSEAELVWSAITSVKDDQMQRKLFDHALRYIEIKGTTYKGWERIKELVSQKGWDGYAFDGYLQQSKHSEELEKRRNSGSLSGYKPKPDPPKDWGAIFNDLDPSSAESIQVSYRRFRQEDPPFYIEQFTKQFFQRVPQGCESDALEAIFSVPDFSLYNLRDVYEAIPEKWVSRNYIRSTLFDITRTVCKTHFYGIAKSQYYQPLPYEVITRCSGVTEQQIYQWVIDASAENPLILGSGRLFSLVGLIAPLLTPQQAVDTLDYGLKLLEEDMTDSDGDGDWSPSLRPPIEVSASMAGYIWASLASPHTSERWEGAHVVCLLCSFEKQDILSPLLSFATGKESKPFHDATLPFYDLSAKLWLLIALRRALKLGYSKAVLFFMEFVRHACNPKERHLMLRGMGAKILLELHQNGQIELPKEEVKRLATINTSKQELVETDTYSLELTVPTPRPESDEDKYYFGHDISRYWFESLGRRFAFGATEIEHRALKILREEWGVLGHGGWNEDARHHRKLYGGDYETGHSHGSYPRTEDLSFYHSYHSMMIVAGDLVDTAQRYQNKEYSDEFEDWISRHQLTRSDGLWLADRRDPKPIEVPKWKSEQETDDWQFSVTKDDLLSVLMFGDQSIRVWGDWNYSEGDREEDIRISSALVNVKLAHSLMRALQTTSNPHDYRIPPSENELEIDSGPYQLKGWIWETSRELGIDELDPWAGDIVYPPLRPAKWFSVKNDLQSDYERRVWHSSITGSEPILYSYTWGRKSEKNDYVTPERGSHLIADVKPIKTWLSSIGMDLIIEVQISRDFRRDSYRRRQAETTEYLPPYTLIVIFRANGKIETL